LELCLRPATRALVRPAPGGWREVVRRHPFLTLYPAALVPNVLASVFNAFYNKAAIVENWSQEAERVFQLIVPVVNGIFFPLGTVVFFLAVRPTTWRPGRAETSDQLAWRRSRCLRLGTMAAAVCVGCWLAAGIVWPMALRLFAGAPPQGAQAYVHFLVSLAVCGLMAAAYPYFLVTYMAVRVLYPAHLGLDGSAATDVPALRRVGRELSFYWAVVNAVPLVAVAPVAMLVYEQVKPQGASDQLRLYVIALAVLSATGVIGTFVAWLLQGRIRADLAALSEAAEPLAVTD
jgi:eukaryotic-like serine/threonine-protein kinase